MNCKGSFFVLCILIVLNSCVEEFVPVIDKYEDLLVVEGAITDAPGPYTIKLSKSAGIREFSPFIPYPNCRIEMMDDQGTREVLTETSPGVYQTAPSGIQSEVGRKYKIVISTPNGEVYESKEELLRKGVGIKSVYGEYQFKNELFFGRHGYQFYLDSEAPEADTNFFYWSLERTYKFRTDFNIHYYYDGSLKIFPDHDSLSLCYSTDKILDLFLLNTNNRDQSQLTRIPLNYEDNYSRALKIRYSLKASQFTISETAYKYWSSIKKIYESQGGMYSQQPFQVKNNIVNVTNPKKPSLGYFMAAGLSEKRIFMDPLYVAFRYPVCVITETDIRNGIQDIFNSQPNQWPFYITTSPSGPRVILAKECVDCRTKGFLKKPDFWIE